MSMRLEKGWGAWGLIFRPDFTTAEAGLDGFINWNKEFIGKSVALVGKQPAKRLVTLTLELEGIDVSNDEAILHKGAAVGYISSGGFAHHIGRSMAMGYVPRCNPHRFTTPKA